LSYNIFDNEILTGYSLYHNDRGTRGGGVMLAFKNTIPSCIMTSPPDLEALSVNVGGNNPKTFFIVYTRPSSTDTISL